MNIDRSCNCEEQKMENNCQRTTTVKELFKGKKLQFYEKRFEEKACKSSINLSSTLYLHYRNMGDV